MTQSKKQEESNKDEHQEDLVYENESDFDVSKDDGDKAIKKIKKLREDLENCQKEKQEYLDGWQRSKADYINLKNRADEEKQNIRQYGNESLISDLILVMDSFEMAFRDKQSWNSAPENWRIGVEYIYNQLVKTLGDYGLSEVNPIGEKFNPQAHQSTEMVEVTDPKQEDVILEVLQKGYKIKDRYIRFASVKVGFLKKD